MRWLETHGMVEGFEPLVGEMRTNIDGSQNDASQGGEEEEADS